MESVREEFIFEIGYFMGRSNALNLAFDPWEKINYNSLKFAHLNWRFLRNLDLKGQPTYKSEF